jgi:hypothetical protein
MLKQLYHQRTNFKSSPNVIKKFTQCHKKIHPQREKNPPNVPLAGSKKGKTETANALI